MLCIIFTKKRLLAGVKTEIPQLLKINGKSHISFEGRAMHEVLEAHLANIAKDYATILKESGKETNTPLQATLAFPVDVAVNEKEKQLVEDVLRNASPYSFEPVHAENLALSFLYGLKHHDNLPDQNCIILESIDDYLHVCYHLHKEGEDVDVKEFGALALHTDEVFDYRSFRNIGYSKGSEQVLNELLKEFGEAGLSVDVKGQTDLAFQLMRPNKSQQYIYSLSKRTQYVNIQAEIELDRRRFSELMATNKEKLHEVLNSAALDEKGIKKVILLGSFLKNKNLREYLKHPLKLEGNIVSMDGGSEYDEFATIIEGLDIRTKEVLDAEAIRQQEEERKRLEAEKRAKIEAELKVKDSRESLLEELQQVCIDPEKQEEYEDLFVNRGIKLGIPEVVIKWNISEVLSRIALQKEVESVGLSSEEQKPNEDSQQTSNAPKIEPQTPPSADASQEPVLHENGKHSSTDTNGHVPLISQESEPIAKELDTPSHHHSQIGSSQKTENPVATIIAPTPPKTEKVQSTPSPEVLTKTAEKEIQETEKVVEEVKEEKVEKPVEKVSIEKEKKIESKEEKKPKAKQEEKKSETEGSKEKEAEVEKKKTTSSPKISLNDIFVIKGSLPDVEFSSKRVTFQSDQEMKVVRLLSVKDQKDEEQVKKFKHLYKKELSYFEDMSELSESKEGLYYYRPFLERNTLKDHVVKLGLDKKKNLDDLSSSDLKFILQIFKEVRELKVSHANLTEENILILAKRKWNLQKNMEIKFIGFTSEEVENQEMIEQTHTIFSKLMGEELYKEFREKFQL